MNSIPVADSSESHEAFLHLQICGDRINSAWRTLKMIEQNLGSALIAPAFKYALVEYATAFTRSDGPVKKRRLLLTAVVPAEHIALHMRVVNSRHSVLAHADLTVLNVKVLVSHINGKKIVSTLQNHITGLEELSQLSALVEMMEAVLDNLYVQRDTAESFIEIEAGSD